MDLIFTSKSKLHHTGNHPESENRLSEFKNLTDYKLVESQSYLTLVHDLEYIKIVKEKSLNGEMIDPDTTTSHNSFEAAVAAVSLAVEASKTNNFALTRPPGHHAYQNAGHGFCLFNNIAIAVRRLVNLGKRVAIFDFDGHYGDGTASIFYNTNKVLYISLHQHDVYPGNGKTNEIGSGAGLGYTINFPIPSECGDDGYKNATDSVLPYISKFKPDYIAVSAGFDGFVTDPLLTLHLTTNTFFELGQKIKQQNLPTFAVLEGGYNPHSLFISVKSFLEGFNGQSLTNPMPRSESRIPLLEEIDITKEELNNNLKKYWEV